MSKSNLINHNESTSVEDAKLALILEDYLSQVEQGRAPDVREIIKANPDIADRLQGCLDSLRMVHSTTGLFDFGTGGQTEKTPQSLGDYHIVREIARGCMGVVYEAEQISLNRRVALKVLPFASMLDQRQLQRFKNEAMAAAQLDHPNIVHVHGTGCERGVHYYAMQFIEGDTLAGVIERTQKLDQPARSASKGPLPDSGSSLVTHHSSLESDTGPLAALSTEWNSDNPVYYRTIAELGIQIAEALEYAHSMGIVHRDIKPSNLMIDAQGKVWVTDFGLAQIETNTDLTMTGDVIGTLRYINPEQAAGKSGFVDHRTDVYSLGATLYELFTLQPVLQEYLAWFLANCPDSEFRNPSLAVTVARKAFQREERKGQYHNTLGVTLYRAGRFESARSILDRSVLLNKGGDGSDWIFLAMTHWRLNNHKQAHDWYRKAANWIDDNKPHDLELKRFRIEAARLLGIPVPAPQPQLGNTRYQPVPKNVFRRRRNTFVLLRFREGKAPATRLSSPKSEPLFTVFSASAVRQEPHPPDSRLRFSEPLTNAVESVG